MSKREPEFGWKTPPPGEQYPTVGELVGADEWEEDADVLEWFAETRAPGALKDNRPLSDWIRVLRTWSQLLREFGRGDYSGVPTDTTTGQWVLYSIDRALARVAAWLVRALEGSKRDGQIDVRVDAGFVRDELCRADDTSAGGLQMPAGFGTLYFAARCALAGGQHLKIFGSKSQSMDVEWTTLDGGKFVLKPRAVPSPRDTPSQQSP